MLYVWNRGAGQNFFCQKDLLAPGGGGIFQGTLDHVYRNILSHYHLFLDLKDKKGMKTVNKIKIHAL